MDTVAPRNGDFRASGIERLSYSVPDSFFPLEDATAPSTATNGTGSLAQIWSNHFHGPRETQLRAWSRVEIPSQTARNFAGTIMKRVGFPVPRDTDAPTIPAPVAPKQITELPTVAEDGMPARRVVRRLNSHKPSDETWESEGKPLSRLVMTSLYMQAQADVADCLRSYPTSTTRAETRQRQVGHYVQIIPLKRRAGTAPPRAGNSLRTYDEVSKLPKATPFFRVPARRFSVLPRPQATSPTPSPIALFTPNQEPVTPAAVMEPPRCMSDAKSPTKRSPRHKSPPIKNEGPRISEPAVKLLPATTPKIGPSPVKPASPPPATPLREARRLRGTAATPSTFPRAAPFGTAFAGMRRHSALRPEGAAALCLSPTRLISTPCRSHCSNGRVSRLSPSKRTISVTATPSRSAPADAMTPRIFSNISYLTADVPSPVAYVSSLFSDSPAKVSRDLPSATQKKQADFDFGTQSPSFNSVTWLNDTEATPRPVVSMKKTSRRQSEPLIRSCLEAQNRRRSMSPLKKLVFQTDQAFIVNGQSVNRRQTISSMKNMPQARQTFNESHGLFSPAKKVCKTRSPPGPKFALPPKLRNARRSLDNNASGASRQAGNEVMNIDMRQNPDIFGTKAISLSVSPVLGATLPSIVESGPEPAQLQLFSPSVEIESHRDVDQTPGVETPAKLQEVASKGATNSPVVNSPVGGMGISGGLPTTDSPLVSIEQHQEVADTEPSAIAQSPSPVTSAAASRSPQKQKLSPSPTLNLSFTPVNSRSPNAVDARVQAEESIPESPPTVTTEIVETVTAQSHDYDSPGRAYMREFIRRSRPKRPSTTEAGSPVGLTVKRQPLGPKSPNTESPTKNKRKHEKEHDQHESPLKRACKASPKNVRRHGKNVPRANDNLDGDIQMVDVQDATDVAAKVDEDDAGSDSTSRRSSRLRNQTRLRPAKSAIPTPITIGRNNGPTLNSAVRSVQQDLTNQTRANTRKNRGDAEYPCIYLAKRQAIAAHGEPSAERESSSEKEDGRKCVNWSDPLATYQEDDTQKEEGKGKGKQPRRPRAAPSSKSSKTVQSGIAKPVTRAKTTADKQRTARLAEHFGMVSNGTPAKPQRATRSRMRV